jgi:hypothetical protein
MKKIIFYILLSGIVSISAYSQVPRFTSAGGLFFTNYTNGGGFGDIGFLIFNRNLLDIRNHLVFRGAGLSESSGLFSLSDKLSIGQLVEKKFRSYGYLEGGIGLWGNEKKGFFDSPVLTYTFGAGGGTDIFLYEEYFSIYFEAGALIYALDSEWLHGGMFSIGWKGWF